MKVAVGVILGILILVGGIAVGGWQLGWWMKSYSTSRSAQIYQQSYGAHVAGPRIGTLARLAPHLLGRDGSTRWPWNQLPLSSVGAATDGTTGGRRCLKTESGRIPR